MANISDEVLICFIHKELLQFTKKKTNNSVKEMDRGFPGGAVVKNPPANAGDVGSSPGPGRFHMPQCN